MRIELTIEVLQTSALPLGYRAFANINDPSRRSGFRLRTPASLTPAKTAQLGYRALDKH